MNKRDWNINEPKYDHEKIRMLYDCGQSYRQIMEEIGCSVSVVQIALGKLPRKRKKKLCPPHDWDDSDEHCTKCGDKDWMT